MVSKVLGLDEIQRKLDTLPDKIQQRVLASGNGAVARAIAKEMKTGLSGSIHPFLGAVKVASDPEKRKTKGYIIGLRKPFSSLAHFFEFGTGPRTQKTTGRYTGSMPAQPFMRPAIEGMSAEDVELIWTKAAGRNLERQLKNL